MKTVRLSNLPSPSVSSKIRMRSLRLSFGARRDGVACTPRRPTAGRGRRGRTRSAGATSGSPANSVTVKPSGTVIALAASSGGRPAYLYDVRRRQRADLRAARGNARLRLVEAEVVEVDVAHGPSRYHRHGLARLVVHQLNRDVLADVRLQVDDHGAHRPAVGARHREDHLPLGFLACGHEQQIDARAREGTAGQEETWDGCTTLNGADVSVPLRIAPPVLLPT